MLEQVDEEEAQLLREIQERCRIMCTLDLKLAPMHMPYIVFQSLHKLI